VAPRSPRTNSSGRPVADQMEPPTPARRTRTQRPITALEQTYSLLVALTRAATADPAAGRLEVGIQAVSAVKESSCAHPNDQLCDASSGWVPFFVCLTGRWIHERHQLTAACFSVMAVSRSGSSRLCRRPGIPAAADPAERHRRAKPRSLHRRPHTSRGRCCPLAIRWPPRGGSGSVAACSWACARSSPATG
jgi:hypothetical protein